MKLKPVSEILPATRVILRMDLDTSSGDNARITKSIPTIRWLLKNKCKIAILGHKGRPQGEGKELSLRPIYLELMSLLEPSGENTIESIFLETVDDRERIDLCLAKNDIVFLENLRFWPGEEANDPDFLKELVEVCQFFVNDAFAVAHRRHRSIMLHNVLPTAYGFAFVEEAERITKILESPTRPLTVILGGAKEDKLSHLEKLVEMADNVLIGGKLPVLVKSEELKVKSEKTIIAELREDKCDLSDKDIEKFTEVIAKSQMIIWAGAMGWFEKDDCKKGTEEIARAIGKSEAYKIVAGGDTTASLRRLGMTERVDLVASGGGVMLELLAKGTLPAWEKTSR